MAVIVPTAGSPMWPLYRWGWNPARLFGQVFQLSISEGALANLFQAVKARFDHRVMEILTRLRRSRLICSDETSARVNGRNQWEWVFQNDEVCIHVIRPSRGHGVRIVNLPLRLGIRCLPRG